MREYMRKWYAKNKDAVREGRRTRPSSQPAARLAYRLKPKAVTRNLEYNKKYMASPAGRARVLMLSAKKRAKRAGLPFNLAIEDVLPLIELGTCQRTGIPFVLERRGDARMHPFAPSLDRVTAVNGYVRGNVEIVCWIYNVCKCDFSEMDVKKFVLEFAATLVSQRTTAA